MAEGFKIKPGWRGSGVYFWEAYPDDLSAFDLAQLWCKKNEQKWAKDGFCSKAAILESTIDHKVPTFNLRDRTQRKQFYKFLDRTLEHRGEKVKLDPVSRCRYFDLYLDALEVERKEKIVLLKTSDKAPTVSGVSPSNYELITDHPIVVVIDVICILNTKRCS